MCSAYDSHNIVIAHILWESNKSKKIKIKRKKYKINKNYPNDKLYERLSGFIIRLNRYDCNFYNEKIIGETL